VPASYLVWPKGDYKVGIKVLALSPIRAAEFGCCCLNDLGKLMMFNGDELDLIVLNIENKRRWEVRVRRRDAHTFDQVGVKDA
jgi:hypothetical protein